MRNERLRLSTALAGIAMWSVYPFFLGMGSLARRDLHCAGRVYEGRFDECFNDALPMFEIMSFALTALLAYPSARFAFAMFAPEPGDRNFHWPLAATSGAGSYFPVFHYFAGAGLIWSGLHLAFLPISEKYWHLTAYWIGWIAWFVYGAFVSIPSPDRRGLE